MNSQSLFYLCYPETPVSLHSPQGETDVRRPRRCGVAGVGGGLIRLAVGTASEGSPPLLEVKFTHTLKIHRNRYQWTDPLPNQTIDDRRSLLNKVLKLMRPDVQTNVYAELAKIKSIKPVDYTFNTIKWHSAIESKRISIENKVPGVYHESQYTMDYLDASLTVEVKSFKAEVNILCNRYLCGNPDRWNASYLSGEIIKTYNNMLMMELGSKRLVKRIRLLRLPKK
jgi:hypothetical protein